MEKNYDPSVIEKKWYQVWLDRKLFHSDSGRGGEPYCVMIPPPNVTGILHMGHALNNTIQDILIRWRRMQGRNVVWMPGTDHAGIATQNVVERAIKGENLTREDLGRDKFIERVWQWREEYGNTIINQLKRLGASCDWDRERFTMDDGLSDAVAEVFVQLYNKGLIYKADYIINWCPRCHTALSDEESEHADTRGKLYYIKYPVYGAGQDARKGDHKVSEYIIVATTRPETLLGDVAVAVNPADKRYKALEKKTIVLPVLGRELKVIKDDLVDPEFGTGVVKVTPAHDPNDFDMGQRHQLDSINVMNGDGTMNSEAGPYAGMERFACRKKIVEDLKDQGLIDRIEDHQHAVGHCYRCDTVVEPRLSCQWFVKMKPLAKPAIEAVNSGKVEFVPARWTKVYLEWMENIRDWCISRQIWWGHRIPVFYCDACQHQWAAKGQPAACPACGCDKIRQDEDVLDTWFSSWLWPFSTFGWPEYNKDLKFYYPSNDLVTASEIIFFWVARMIMAGLEFMGDVPFSKVYIHGTVRDDHGRKMSKSLGNSIDPLTVIDQFSADALRFSLMMITATGQDVYLSDDKFEIGRNFGTKLWNASRYMHMHLEQLSDDDAREVKGSWVAPAFDKELLSPDDKHILAGLNSAITGCADNLDKCRFNDAALALYEFVWHQFCDWYVEYSKDVLYGDDQARRKQVLSVMYHVVSQVLRLLHPFMPFVTEELWHELGYGGEDDSIMTAVWPEPVDGAALKALGITQECVDYVEDKHEIIRAGRTLRSDYGVAPSQQVNFSIKPHSKKAAELLAADVDSIKGLLRAEVVEVDRSFIPKSAMPSGVARMGTIYMPVEGLIDVESEIQRLTRQLEKVTQDLERTSAKLDNAAFVGKAPEEVVNKQRQRKKELIASSEKYRKLVETLTSI